ncbi:hypothetical protein [Candidatus Venteria ishoeyi]|uniref:Uncharacterized protein n=1 Tax=Candidatus Venteria ishoeyi TaxID=1899563 RepID=A0A1H6F290_9GAMM|nr:hypothetical protein [Candidatus Venteria ishoeyi]SEH04267.1 Uncharacterised protein [Candidatus Venteria ishoeyi]
MLWNSGEFNDETSFSGSLITKLRRGSQLSQAFLDTRNKLNHSNIISQSPWLDADGDGMNTTADEEHINRSEICLGICGIAGSQPPQITQILPAPEIGGSSALLWAKTSHHVDDIYKVRAILVSPDMTISEYQGQNTDFGRIEIELTYNDNADPEKARYEAEYDHFCTPGLWKVFYEAQGTDGAWSDTVSVDIVQKQIPDNAQCQQSGVNVAMLLNQTKYQAGDDFILSMQVNGQQTVTPYIAIILPDGSFVTYSYNLGFSFPNALYPYRETLSLDGLRTYPILSFPMSAGLPSGEYQACGVLLEPQVVDVLNVENWLSIDCVGFGL